MATSSSDRLGVTILFSLIAHAVIALGISFDYEKMLPRLPSLEVILLQSSSGENPDKADFLAQANNSGGGESDKPKRPADLLSGPMPQGYKTRVILALPVVPLDALGDDGVLRLFVQASDVGA